MCHLAEVPPIELPASRECDARLRCPGLNRRPPGVSRAVPALRDSREIPPRFRTGHLVVALRSSPASKTNFGASDSIPFPPRFPRIRCARSAAGLRRRFGLMVKSLVAVEISHYTSDTGHPLYGLLVPYPRSGFTITAVTFSLRYLLLNCRQPGACLLVRQMQIPRCGRACARRLRR